MSLPPRQPRPLSAVGAPRRVIGQPAPPDMTFGERVQHALDASRTAIPRIPEPGGFAYVPLVGPAWETAVDLQDGDYAGAAFNMAMLATELSPAGPALRVAKLVKAINGMKKNTRLLASSNTQLARIRKIEKEARKRASNPEDFVIHHSIPMKGAASTSREARRIPGLWRNHPANLKILPKHIHDRVHNGFGNRYTDPALKLWHGTTDIQKTTAAALSAGAVDAVENANRLKRPPPR